jgi:PKHD-type hydroxylase
MIYPIDPMAAPGKDTYAYWEGFLTEEQINRILAAPEWLNAQAARIGGVSNGGAVNENVRRTDVSWMYPTSATKDIWDCFSDVVARINSTYFKFDLTGFYEAAQLTLYSDKVQGHYNWHTDASPTDIKTPRKLSMVLMLSDPSEFEGGELQIKVNSDEPITLEQKRGRVWFFPSYVLHRVTPVTKGTRRTLVLWVGGPDFK